MAKITRNKAEKVEDIVVTLHLDVKEAITLHTVLRYVSGAGHIRDNIRKIHEAFDDANIDYYHDVKAVEGKDDLRFRD